ncbi:hypothetical protein [Pseudorhodobacter sp.]|uniref:hypothetical protein n=1 Tax=Pseudorhodobacter sp. TaxID=1934400 RepID=UPI0026490036|nr:hypothetical protein [Pseudorhodobacter sp.]MDN5786526.1 hypothetical protein [Pseudorhodobacter sp.]
MTGTLILCTFAATAQFFALRFASNAGFAKAVRGHSAAREWAAISAGFQVVALCLLFIAYWLGVAQ